MISGEFVALLATVTLPDKLPAATGENVTSNVALCPGARINPAETPLVVSFAPAGVTLEIVTLELPALESVTGRVLDAPEFTFPKFKLLTLALRSVVAATPVPVTETVLGVEETSLKTETLPEKAPAVLGENAMLRFDCCPGAIVTGKDAPEAVNPPAGAVACITVRLEPPPLVMVMDWETVPFIATDPKAMDAGDTEIAAGDDEFCVCCVEVFCAPVTPVQPEIDAVPASRINHGTTRN